MPDSRNKPSPRNSEQSAPFHKYGMANYSLEHRMYRAENGELFILQWLPFGDNTTIAARLGRTTFSHSLKSYPRRPPSKPRYHICFIDQNAPFQAVSKRKVDQITRRLSTSTTEASRRMHDTDKKGNKLRSQEPKSEAPKEKREGRMRKENR